MERFGLGTIGESCLKPKPKKKKKKKKKGSEIFILNECENIFSAEGDYWKLFCALNNRENILSQVISVAIKVFSHVMLSMKNG
jgi:hypothetical protein